MHLYLQLLVHSPIITNNVHEYTNEIIQLKIQLIGQYSIKVKPQIVAMFVHSIP